MDISWWKMHIDEVRESFRGQLLTAQAHCFGAARIGWHRNSGAGAIAAAAHFGASRIILIGYDCQHTGGKTHWHGSHPRGLGDAGSVHKWPAQFARVARELKGIEIINCSRETALTCFKRARLEDVLSEYHDSDVAVAGQ